MDRPEEEDGLERVGLGNAEGVAWAGAAGGGGGRGAISVASESRSAMFRDGRTSRGSKTRGSQDYGKRATGSSGRKLLRGRVGILGIWRDAAEMRFIRIRRNLALMIILRS